MSGDRWAKHPVTDGVVVRDHLTTQGVDPQPETWKTGTETTPPGDATTGREADNEPSCPECGDHDGLVVHSPDRWECLYCGSFAPLLPEGALTKVREALAATLSNEPVGDPLDDCIDNLLVGPLSDPTIVARLPGAAGLVRELDEANELGAVALAVALALEEARAKLAQVEKYAGVLADTGPRVYAGSEVARMLRNAIGGTS